MPGATDGTGGGGSDLTDGVNAALGTGWKAAASEERSQLRLDHWVAGFPLGLQRPLLLGTIYLSEVVEAGRRTPPLSASLMVHPQQAADDEDADHDEHADEQGERSRL